jgi:hypothetical protein
MDDLTILFQGRYSPGILSFSRAVAQDFPDLPIIVSCWEADRADVPAELATYAQVVFSPDPGAVQVPGHKLDNVSRQLVSTQAGLAHVRTDYVLKLRSDMTVSIEKILALKSLCTAIPASAASLFRRKVVVTSLTTLDPRFGHYFHVCDWLYLGLTADVAELFGSVDLPDEAHFRYFASHPELELASRYRPEAYIAYSLVKQRGISRDYAFSGQASASLEALGREVLRTNFVVLNPWSLGLQSEKHKHLHLWIAHDRYTETTCGSYHRSLPFAQRQRARLLDMGSRMLTAGAIRAARIKRLLKGRA